VGQEYPVLELTAVPERSPVLRIAIDAEYDHPTLWSAEMFITVSDLVPSHWRARVDQTGTFWLGPPQWLSHQFWHDYFDGKPKAVEEYRLALAQTLAAER
jgi:hypothetical protein